MIIQYNIIMQLRASIDQWGTVIATACYAIEVNIHPAQADCTLCSRSLRSLKAAELD